MKTCRQSPKCPKCGSPLVLYSEYVACERLDCGGMQRPEWLGLPAIATLRRLFPWLASSSPADLVVRR